MDVGLEKLKPTFIRELQLVVLASWNNIPCRSLRLSVKRGVDTVCSTILMPWVS